MQQTFWVVPKQNPEVIMRQIIQQNPGGPDVDTGDQGGGNQGGGNPGNGGGNGNGITIPGG